MRTEMKKLNHYSADLGGALAKSSSSRMKSYEPKSNLFRKKNGLILEWEAMPGERAVALLEQR